VCIVLLFLSKVEIDLLAFSFIDKWSVVKLQSLRHPLMFKTTLKPLACKAKCLNVILFKVFTVVCKWQMFQAPTDL